MSRARLLVAGLVVLHLTATAVVAFTFARFAGHLLWSVVSHTALVAAWHALALVVLAGLVATAPRRVAWIACAVVPAATILVLVHLYLLNLVTLTLWGQHPTWRMVAAFAPTFLSGHEPLPVGPGAAAALSLVLLAASVAAARWWTPLLVAGLGGVARPRIAAALVLVAPAFGGFLGWGLSSDWLFWRGEMVVAFFKPTSVHFEPTPRRNVVADRDAVVRASYPSLPGEAARRHVILIVADSLRADRMGVYGYSRPTTPFLSSLVEQGRMRRVEFAAATCPESYCGLTTLLASREFRDVSARTFTLTEALRSRGYRTRFLLSGNHLAWYGLGHFYGPGAIFEGSQSQRYTIDDDRVVLEGLDAVPPADGTPTFFQIHLMSTHYLGVRLPAFRRYAPGDVSPASVGDPQTILSLLQDPDRYDDKVEQVDDFVRRIYAELDRKGYLRDALVIVTSDHGEGLGERHWGHGRYLYAEDIRVPLLIQDDPSASYARLDVAAQIDIAPTILDRLGLPIPASWRGESLLRSESRPYSFHQAYRNPVRHAVVYRSGTGVYTYLTSSGGEGDDDALYDVTRDPGQQRDLAAARPDLLRQLRDALRAHLAEEP